MLNDGMGCGFGEVSVVEHAELLSWEAGHDAE